MTRPPQPPTSDLEHSAVLPQGDALRVMGHPEVMDVVTDAHTFSSAVSRFLQIPNGLDGQEHAKARAILDEYFTEPRMMALEPSCREVARALVAELPRGQAVDVVPGLGTQYAVRAMLRWLGWPSELELELVDWVASNAEASRSGELERTRIVAQQFDDIISSVITPRLDRLDQPPVDVTDELLRERVDDRLLTHDELVSILRNWTGGDLGSLALCVGVVLHLIAADPEIEADVRSRRRDPDALGRAIDELLRIDDPFVSNRRRATVDTELAGCPIHAGDRVFVDWTNANRDPRVFPEPDRYAPETHASHNLVYGAGPHVCPGRPLATLELRVLLEEVLDATSDLTLEGAPPGTRAQRPLGGWSSAPVVLR
ncbi:cytochrome P450 [Tessaracoccus sp. OS52]|uniref:cytochrome P450 n=1 Tax=Tessaracoccus sp. OS52 TaxID=2886691 RepID=UPI001D113F61|nr:cytochrome P450 [Tessaracoccus sp. OS52]MCC2593196.1 cytochrome P450 [Tessaracoccus sp. OS52]